MMQWRITESPVTANHGPQLAKEQDTLQWDLVHCKQMYLHLRVYRMLRFGEAREIG